MKPHDPQRATEYDKGDGKGRHSHLVVPGYIRLAIVGWMLYAVIASRQGEARWTLRRAYPRPAGDLVK